MISFHPGVSHRASKLNFRVPNIRQHENENLKFVRFGILHFEHLSDLRLKIFETMRASLCGPAEFQSQETEDIYTEGSVLVPRVVPSSKLRHTIRQGNKQIQTGCYRQEDRLLELDLETSDTANEDVQFIEHQFEEPLASSGIEVEVHAWGVDSQSVFAKPSSMIGEFSGTVVNVGSDVQSSYRTGDRACCWGGSSYFSLVQIDATRACHLPEPIPFSVAASVPVIFSTAYHGLVALAGLAKGQTVLIHASTESTCEAAVRIAQYIGVKVVVIADGANPQDLAGVLGLPREVVLSSSSDIVWHVHVLTEGQGVDVVFSTTKNQLPEEGYACVKPFGRYIEIRTPGGSTNRKAAKACLDKNIVFCSVKFEALMRHRSLEVREHVGKLLSWFDDGLLKPLHHVEMNDVSEIAKVYKTMKRGSDAGKQVLEITKDSIVKWTTKRKVAGKINPNATLVLAGGLGH